AQRAQDTAEQAKSELRSLLMSHLSLIDRAPLGVPHATAAPAPAAAARAGDTSSADAPAPTRPVIRSETDEFERLPMNGAAERRLVE
ncbi:MAG: hypothetical protein QOI11_2297, partial [Candidatus Eremiobacteraeota bacterium]|nr:hypothetical protein [Candidatus Eremiobacteraeota bacterium]